MSWRTLLRQAYDESEDRDDLVDKVTREFYKYGFFVGLQYDCWCEGKATGTEHTPGCPGIKQDKLLKSLE